MSVHDLSKLRSENEHILRHNREVALDYALNIVPKQFEMIEAIVSGQEKFGPPTRLNRLYENIHLRDTMLHNKFRQD